MKLLSLFVFLFLSEQFLFAQPPAAIESDLLKLFKKIDYHSKDYAAANTEFGKKLAYYAEKYPATINQDFKLLKKAHLYISTSADGLYRIYSWESFTDGNVTWFENVTQYKAGARTFSSFYSSADGDYGDIRPKDEQIFTLKYNRKTYYLVVYISVDSTPDVVGGIQAFTIDDGKLTGANLFQTIADLRTNELTYGYNFSSITGKSIIKKPVVNFDSKNLTIRLVLADTTNGNLAYKHYLYKFNGQYFKKVKN